MKHRKKILAISGSTRKHSSNLYLINAIAKLYADKLNFIIYEGISELPHFDPDYTDDTEPKPVKNFKQQIRNSDGVLICTPEYAHGVPGSLKNAIDWTVSSSEFSKKPTVLITASTDGRLGHLALLETLRVIEAENIDELQLLIQFIKTKLDGENRIKDENLLTEIHQLITRFIAAIDRQNK